MRDIQKYNSSYPLAYYEIGTVYSFYGGDSITGTPASSEIIQRYATVLNDLVSQEQENAIKPVKNLEATNTGRSGLHRFYAVIVDKVKSGKDVKIVVMFRNKNGDKIEYYTKQYAVNHSGCETDGKDLMPTSDHLDLGLKSNNKIGGVAKIRKDDNVGGVAKIQTYKDGNEFTQIPSGSSIGGVARVRQSDRQVTESHDIVGGVARVRKNEEVGGVARVKR